MGGRGELVTPDDLDVATLPVGTMAAGRLHPDNTLSKSAIYMGIFGKFY